MHPSSLGDPITRSNGVELSGGAASLPNTLLDPFCELAEMKMTWIDFAP